MATILLCLLCLILGIVLGVVAKNPKVENWVGRRLPWNPPPYVTIGSRRNDRICAMKLERYGDRFQYYRDAGRWSLEFKRWMLFWYRVKKYEPGSHRDHLSGQFLHRISYKVWAEDNAGYIGDNRVDDEDSPFCKDDQTNLVLIDLPHPESLNDQIRRDMTRSPHEK